MKTIHLFLCLLFHTACFSRTFYISATQGNDSYSETAAQNPATPWKSLARLNGYFTLLRPGDSVLLMRANIFEGSIVASASGTANAPIVIAAYGKGERPVVKGTKTLTNWENIGKGIWECYDPTLPSVVNNLMIDNVPQELGRWPNSNAANKGYLTIGSANADISISGNELLSSPNWTGAEVVIRKQRWKLDRSLITAQAGNTLTFEGGAADNAKAGFGYFIQNDLRTLDRFGEWYYNPAAKKIAVFLGEKKPASLALEAAKEAFLFSAKKCSNVTIDGLVFRGANSDAIKIGGGSNVTVQNCIILSAGRYAINMSDHDNGKIENCDIRYANEGGIRIGGNFAQVRNNRIENTGMFAGMGLAKGNGLTAVYCSSSNGLIEYNTIRNTGYIGIQFKEDSVTIRYNVVDSFCLVTDDGGGIYAHNSSKKNLTGRTIFRNIVINGIGVPEGTRSANSAAEGIYMDDNANGVEIAENTVANCGSRGIYLHNCRDILVTENTVYNNATQFFTQHDNLGDPLRNCVIVRNIFFSPVADQYLAQHYSTSQDIHEIGRFDSNYYFRPSNGSNIIKVFVKGNAYYSLDSWKSKFRKDGLSAAGQTKFAGPAGVRFVYNPTPDLKTVALDGTYTDVRGKSYKKTVTLEPFTSVILGKTGR